MLVLIGGIALAFSAIIFFAIALIGTIVLGPLFFVPWLAIYLWARASGFTPKQIKQAWREWESKIAATPSATAVIETKLPPPPAPPRRVEQPRKAVKPMAKAYPPQRNSLD